ncbi:hypothetical protein SEVIR_8G004800v4 [Setaria viridis]|uniref:CMP/dCMP-type deaminase domain-containing protein n=1 Tax=Setaria viridis TaxID=4556 RepID=A0A4U6TBX5_SETVI|nr:tRNA-specific adenosine deaminase TAD3-like [Setaria viridis]TKV98910.1 hypothetical protein SEVIR_8G004800v2 [Setaria viridis]TKV98911.1 hypothetical protein SEVIR_8G004800v2 [Setaria viridis]
MGWELTEVPGNPTPSLQDSTVDVVAANIEPKLANALIRELSTICPLENLRHVKRVRRCTECGKSDLSIILCLSTGSQTCIKQLPGDVQKIVDTYQLSPFIVKVAKCSATSKEEWEEQCKLWPTSYHPAHNLDIIRGFRDDELPSIFNCMKTAIQLSKAGNAAIIVDPSSMQIIAKATDQTHKHDTSAEGNKLAEVKANDTFSLDESTENNGNLLRPSSRLSKCNSLNMEVSCINPLGWTKQRTTEQKPLPCEGCFAWHPLRHAAMVAIENAAERDRMLFPSSTPITMPDSNGNLEDYLDNEPAKRLKTDTKDKEQSTDESCCGDLSETTRPYLCTGFDIYLVWEPCAMCAMALVHQRFKRVFYAFRNPVTGALGGVYRLHGEKSLNHHYNVFQVSVPETYLNGLSDC